MNSDVHRGDPRDPHDVLGVPRGADRQEVIRAFHRKARRGGHPDTGGDAQTFDDIIRARDALLDRVGRAASVAERRPGQATAPPSARPRRSPPARRGGSALVVIVLVLLYVFALPVLLRVLTLLLIR